MALVINTNVNSLDVQRNLTNTTNGLSKTFQRLASGMRINTASDDAAGLAISTRMSAQISGLSQAVRNANDGISLVQVAEGAMEESVNALQRIRELAVQAANGTVTSSDRKDMQLEVNQLLSEIQRIANDTQFNGFSMLQGNFLNQPRMVIQVGAREGQAISFSINDMRISALGNVATSFLSFDATDVAHANGTLALSTDGQTARLYSPLSVAIGTQSAAESTITRIDKALDRVSIQRSQLGAIQNRFTSVITNLNNVVENMSAARSRIMDADIAAETANLTQKSILQQAGVAVLAQANQQPNLALKLLQ